MAGSCTFHSFLSQIVVMCCQVNVDWKENCHIQRRTLTYYPHTLTQSLPWFECTNSRNPMNQRIKTNVITVQLLSHVDCTYNRSYNIGLTEDTYRCIVILFMDACGLYNCNSIHKAHIFRASLMLGIFSWNLMEYRRQINGIRFSVEQNHQDFFFFVLWFFRMKKRQQQKHMKEVSQLNHRGVDRISLSLC